MNRFAKVGRTAALEAIDQASDPNFGGLEYALDSYFVNLGDTLTEMEASADEGFIATQAFADVLTERGIAFRPHGL